MHKSSKKWCKWKPMYSSKFSVARLLKHVKKKIRNHDPLIMHLPPKLLHNAQTSKIMTYNSEWKALIPYLIFTIF